MWIMGDRDSHDDDVEQGANQQGESDDDALLKIAAQAPHVPPKKRELKARMTSGDESGEEGGIGGRRGGPGGMRHEEGGRGDEAG